MADILYTYKNQVYANITNQCNCRCTFCIRSHEDGVGDAETLWHKKDPTLEEVMMSLFTAVMENRPVRSTSFWHPQSMPKKNTV